MWGPGASSPHRATTFVTTQQNHQIIRTPFDIGFTPYSFEAIQGFKLTHSFSLSVITLFLMHSG